MTKLTSILYRILIVCICFEEMFSRMWIPFKYVKYIVVPAIIFCILSNRRFRIQNPIKESSTNLFIAITTISVIASFPDFLSLDFDGMAVVKKYLFIPLLMICFFYAPYFHVNGKKLLHMFSATMCIYSILNVVLYFVRIPIWNEFQHFYWGRITVGYPTIDVINYAIALTILLLDSFEKEYFLLRCTGSLCLILGIVLQTSGTGFLLLAIILGATIILTTFFQKKANIDKSFLNKTLVVLLISSLTIPSVGFGLLKASNPILLDNMTMQMENRINVLLGEERHSRLEINTMEMRQDQMNRAEDLYLKDDLKKIFGAGFGALSYDSRKGNVDNRVFIESQWNLIRFTSGYVGLLSLVLMCFFWLKSSLSRRNPNIVCFIGFVCIFISFFTACPLMSFGLEGILALLYIHKDFSERLYG